MTGDMLWTSKTIGLCSNTFTMNGIIYYTDAAEGTLNGIDVENGQKLMSIKSPDDYLDSPFFGNVVGKDGKIYVTSYLYIYCYKAVR